MNLEYVIPAGWRLLIPGTEMQRYDRYADGVRWTPLPRACWGAPTCKSTVVLRRADRFKSASVMLRTSFTCMAAAKECGWRYKL